MKCIIYDPVGEGFVYKSPMDGWMYTISWSAAHCFASREEAKQCIEEHYKDAVKDLVIVTLEK